MGSTRRPDGPGSKRRDEADRSRNGIAEAEWVRGVLRSSDERGALYAIVMLSAAGTVLPELLDFFEGDAVKTLSFVERFAGTSVRFPTRSDVLAMTRRVSVVRDIVTEGRTFAETADRHGISPKAAREVFKAGVRLLKQQGVLTSTDAFAAEERRAEGGP